MIIWSEIIPFPIQWAYEYDISTCNLYIVNHCPIIAQVARKVAKNSCWNLSVTVPSAMCCWNTPLVSNQNGQTRKCRSPVDSIFCGVLARESKHDKMTHLDQNIIQILDIKMIYSALWDFIKYWKPENWCQAISFEKLCNPC